MVLFQLAVVCHAVAALEEPLQLPNLDNVLSEAHVKADAFAQQAISMQKQVEAKQQESANRLSNQRLVYEKVLKGETLTNKMIAASNKLLSMNNRDVETRLSEERTKAKETQEDNARMRNTLQSMEKKFILAKDFLSSSLDTMDDRQQEILKVLVPPAPKPTLRAFLKVAASKFGHNVGLLQETSAENPDSTNPQEWVPMLAESLKSIDDAEREGEASLKSQFMDGMRKCNQTRFRLVQEQRTLNATKKQLDNVEMQMSRASGMLANSSSFLLERLGGIKFLSDRLVDDIADVLAQADAILAGDSATRESGNVATGAVVLNQSTAKQALQTPSKQASVHPEAPKSDMVPTNTALTMTSSHLRNPFLASVASKAQAALEDGAHTVWWPLSWR